MAKYGFEKSILDNYELTSTETLVALVMLSHRNNKTGLCYPSHSTIAKEAKLSRRQVVRAVAGLREKGVVSGEPEPGKAIKYIFVPVTGCHTPCDTVSHKPRKNQDGLLGMALEERYCADDDRMAEEMDNEV